MRAQAAAVKVATEIDVGERHGSSADFRSRSLRVVALGGGTGLPVLLRGLRAALFPSGGRRVLDRARQRLTAIVTAADDGGSSGRLRRAYRVSPPGDIRNCLLALSDGDPTLAAIFNFRFNGHDQQEVGGHSLGNLILTALSHLENDFVGAVERANHILGARGRVFPATLEDVRAAASRLDGVANRTPVLTSRTLDERVGAGAEQRAECRRILGIQPERFVVGWIGRMTGVKRTQDVLLAFRRLRGGQSRGLGPFGARRESAAAAAAASRLRHSSPGLRGGFSLRPREVLAPLERRPRRADPWRHGGGRDLKLFRVRVHFGAPMVLVLHCRQNGPTSRLPEQHAGRSENTECLRMCGSWSSRTAR